MSFFGEYVRAVVPRASIFGLALGLAVTAPPEIRDHFDDQTYLIAQQEALTSARSSDFRGTIEVKMDENRFAITVPTRSNLEAGNLAEQLGEPSECEYLIGDDEFRDSQIRQFLSSKSQTGRQLFDAYESAVEVRDKMTWVMSKFAQSDETGFLVRATFHELDDFFVLSDVVFSGDERMKLAQTTFEMLCLG